MNATFPNPEQVLFLHRESLWPWRKLPDPSQQKVVAAIELLILQGRNVLLDGRAIIVENQAQASRQWPRGHQPAARHSRPGDLIRLVSPDEISAFAAYRQTAQRILEDLQLGSFDDATVSLPIVEAIRRTSESDNAHSLDIQARIEAEARRIAWHRTYSKSRSSPQPRIPTAASIDGQNSARKPEPVGAPSPAVPPKGPAAEPPRWHNFGPVAFNSLEVIQGVYAIVETKTGRLYIGSSIHVVRRLNEHAAALRANRHHADRLQEAWRIAEGEGFRFLLVEKVEGSVEALRDREQYWITELRAHPHGFNSKSTADGPEPSLHTRIDAAIKQRWQPLYAPLAPRKLSYTPNSADLSAYNGEMKDYEARLKASRFKKLKYAAITVVLAILGTGPGMGVMWIGVAVFALLAFGESPAAAPDSPQMRADSRAEADYANAVAEARRKTDSLLIRQLADELDLPEATIAAAYPDAPRIVRERHELSEKFRTNPMLRFRAERNRRRSI